MEENKLNLIVEETEKILKKELSCYKYNGHNSYQVERFSICKLVVLSITSTNLTTPFITQSVINDVKRIYESSEWKNIMFYGIETKTVYDKEIGKERIIPSLCIFFEK